MVINRPIARALNKPLAKALLEGKNGSGTTSYPYDFIDRIVQAFGAQAGVYLGGPDHTDGPAMRLHGIANLPGATELAPGTGLYQGGWQAAVDGVLRGDYQPLDFRFVLGRQSYRTSIAADATTSAKPAPSTRGSLTTRIAEGMYQPVACARSLALKQCLGLPKPLWHEGTHFVFAALCVR